jgi:hypothetical protein
MGPPPYRPHTAPIPPGLLQSAPQVCETAVEVCSGIDLVGEFGLAWTLALPAINDVPAPPLLNLPELHGTALVVGLPGGQAHNDRDAAVYAGDRHGLVLDDGLHK